MVHKLRCPASEELLSGRRVASRIALVVLWFLVTASMLSAQEPQVHYLHQGVMPPGAIGGWQLQRGGPLLGYFQPVEIKAPSGALVSLVSSGEFDDPRAAPRTAGMLIGQVYRLRVTNIPLYPGLELFPTIEVIDRTYPPQGEERRFAIPIELTRQDLELARQGKFVTRVIYLEDPNRALPVHFDPGVDNRFDAAPGQDPLALADELGRPVAILRLGGRLPQSDTGPDIDFLFGCPPFTDYPPEVVVLPPPRKAPEQKQL
jgi:hypothetical protein